MRSGSASRSACQIREGVNPSTYTKWRFCPLGSRTWTNEDPRQSHSQQPLTRKEDPWLHIFIGTSDTRTPEPRTWPYRPRGPYGATFLILLLVRPSAPTPGSTQPAPLKRRAPVHRQAVGAPRSSCRRSRKSWNRRRENSWSGGEPPPHGHDDVECVIHSASRASASSSRPSPALRPRR